jgi:hypothetical protein
MYSGNLHELRHYADNSLLTLLLLSLQNHLAKDAGRD